jgi:CRISPR/Cas system CMR-associated protein Cmr5 small subunit
MHNIKDEYIKNALQAVEKYLSKQGKVSKEYDGYAASFTASIVMAGVMPTLSFYTDVHRQSESQPRRYKLLRALHWVITQKESDNLCSLMHFVLKEEYGESALNPAIPFTKQQQVSFEMEQQLIDAAIALKLALRNFEQTDL